MKSILDQPADLLGAKAAASRLLSDYAVSSPEHIVVEDLAHDRGVVTCSGGISGAEAWLLRKGKRGLIRVSDKIRESGRRRFALAHELGHWERHMGQSQAWVCTSGDIHAYRGSNAEQEANAFAAELLMPSALFRAYINQCSDVSFATINHIAREFKTTLTATAVRFVEESRDDCYVVFSGLNDPRVRWSKNGTYGTGFFIAPGQRVSTYSAAFQCDRQPDEDGEMQCIDAREWFASQRHTEDYEVWEESIVLSEYDTVVTLLCIIPQ